MEPLVSAVMVTGKHRQRLKLAQAALQSFLNQTWPNKELVVVIEGDCRLGCEDPRVREIVLPGRLEPYTLGELRNVGLNEARGEWITQYDDDDWQHPDRITYMMDRRQEGRAVLLLWQIRYSFPYNSAFALRYDRPAEGIPGTILHPRTAARYPHERKHEDSHFLNDAFGPRRVILDNGTGFPGPALYLRFYHGLNTWDEQHVMQRYAGPQHQNRWRLSGPQADYLSQTLREHYATQPEALVYA